MSDKNKIIERLEGELIDAKKLWRDEKTRAERIHGHNLFLWGILSIEQKEEAKKQHKIFNGQH